MVIIFVDIAAIKQIEALQLDMKEKKILQEYLNYVKNIVDTVRESLIVLDAELRVISASRSFYQMFQVTPEETEKQLLYDLGSRQWDIPELRRLLEDILPKNSQFNEYKIEHNFPKIGRRVVILNARRIMREDTGTQMILLAMEDITEGDKKS